jgi:hypothetical protein
MDPRLDKIADDIAVIKTDIALIKNDVAHHIRRTDLAEENLSQLRATLKPIKEHVIVVNSVLKVIGVFSILVGIAVGIQKLLIG